MLDDYSWEIWWLGIRSHSLRSIFMDRVLREGLYKLLVLILHLEIEPEKNEGDFSDGRQRILHI